MRVYVKTPSRLHFALIDLNGELGRVDGSIGLALNKPNTILEAYRSRELKVVGEGAEFVEDLVRKFLQRTKVNGTVGLSVKRLIPAHVGLGSGTQLSLAVASALSRIFRIRKTTRELAEIMGRGGTSGIGVTAFERGGLIVDGGHSFGNGKAKQSFLPSSASTAPPPPVLARYEVPQLWKFVVAIPSIQRGFHGKDEVQAFADRCPISTEEVGKVCRLILVRALPSLIERDIVSFGSALNELQEVGFAGSAKDLVHPIARKCIEFMRGEGAHGAGQSSFGPTTFALVQGRAEAEKLAAAVRRFLAEHGGGIAFQASASHGGALVKLMRK
jgi:beta-ribofuranosylaminobenzene 5'-phosphate synthase